MPTPFERAVARVDALVRERAPHLPASARPEPGPGDTVTWNNDGRWATLTLHDGGRLELTLHTTTDAHPETLEILIDDADADGMIAEPVAALLAGKQP